MKIKYQLGILILIGFLLFNSPNIKAQSEDSTDFKKNCVSLGLSSLPFSILNHITSNYTYGYVIPRVLFSYKRKIGKTYLRVGHRISLGYNRPNDYKNYYDYDGLTNIGIERFFKYKKSKLKPFYGVDLIHTLDVTKNKGDSEIDFGLQFMGVVPLLGLRYYITEKFVLVSELGIGYGVYLNQWDKITLNGE
jgi:hypothetical protein